jgi:hypothetical protein
LVSQEHYLATECNLTETPDDKWDENPGFSTYHLIEVYCRYEQEKKNENDSSCHRRVIAVELEFDTFASHYGESHPFVLEE